MLKLDNVLPLGYSDELCIDSARAACRYRLAGSRCECQEDRGHPSYRISIPWVEKLSVARRPSLTPCVRSKTNDGNDF